MSGAKRWQGSRLSLSADPSGRLHSLPDQLLVGQPLVDCPGSDSRQLIDRQGLERRRVSRVTVEEWWTRCLSAIHSGGARREQSVLER